jgi:hypothetical protein
LLPVSFGWSLSENMAEISRIFAERDSWRDGKTS